MEEVAERTMPDKPWKQLEREVAHLLGGRRYAANTGGRVDVESPTVVAQVKHVQRLSLAQLEALAVEMAALGGEQGKIGVVVVKRRAGRGKETPGLIVVTEEAWRKLEWTRNGRLREGANRKHEGST